MKRVSLLFALVAMLSLGFAPGAFATTYTTAWSGNTLTATWDAGLKLTTVYPATKDVVLFDLTKEFNGRKVGYAKMEALFSDTDLAYEMVMLLDGQTPLGTWGGVKGGTAVFDNIQDYLADYALDVKAGLLAPFTSSVKLDKVQLTAQVTPIPGAFWLLGSGLLGLIGIRKRFA